jgi:hypothetical protein
MNACRDLYSACLTDGRDFGVAVDEAFPAGECERMPVSEFSPGCVHAEEKLTRFVIHPIHVNNDGMPVSVVFNDAWSSDLSLFRETRATDAEIRVALAENRATGQARSPPQDRSFFGVMYACASAIRQATFDEFAGPVFRVYDTAEANKPHHASVFMTKAAKKALTSKKVRKKLWETFGSAMAEDAGTYWRGRIVAPTAKGGPPAAAAPIAAEVPKGT